ncbi:uncharacterized protein LOC131657018 [Vicia villosa]|uniref:uncharacterized protein LOC131657018 n=1 Tax=Vicia villosa TaxID=3911 RepID=UPI00273B39E4|nr:uncharacterized protein LOC131657018 [Vicia villosa]
MEESSNTSILSNGRTRPKCGHDLPMKMFISKSKANPGRKYWKCKHWGKEEDCELFLWDDEYFGVDVSKEDRLVCTCETVAHQIKMLTKEIEELKITIDNTRKVVKFVISIVVCYCVFYGIGLGRM